MTTRLDFFRLLASGFDPELASIRQSWSLPESSPHRRSPTQARLGFFRLLARDFGPDWDQLRAAWAAYDEAPTLPLAVVPGKGNGAYLSRAEFLGGAERGDEVGQPLALNQDVVPQQLLGAAAVAGQDGVDDRLMLGQRARYPAARP